MQLSKGSLEWAKNHINRFYDSDFYVKPFEFKAIWSNWGEVSHHLSERSLGDLISLVKRPLIYPTPKHSGGYRMVHQLDPLDSIIYAAMTREVAEYIESRRINTSDDVVFSYRIKVNENGELFDNEVGYEKFKNKSVEYAGANNYVLVTDITDFYNQIYHHRLQNAIQSCDNGLDEISKLIENFMMELTNQVSRGIPVGPSSSIVMAEALMIDIDEYIIGKDLPYIRYVDDIRIFSDDKNILNTVLHDLTSYLYSNHRLILSSSKTKILNSDEYVAKYIDDPHELEKTEIHNAIRELNLAVSDDYGFIEMTQSIDTLPPQSRIKAQGKAFQSFLDMIISFERLDLGLSRHILRRSKYLKSRAILNQVLINFDFFTPVIRDVILYLDSVTSDKMFEYNQPLIESIVTSAATKDLPHIGYWLRNYLASTKFTRRSNILTQFVLRGSLREQGIHAITQKKIPWVREHKDHIDQVGPWDRRAIIYSSQILSKDERNHWMNAISRRDDIVDKSIASYIKSVGYT
ncbi:RNA-directed DNA polymerase [Gorillibacterium sp. CAU 1737]|uniref:RNA-directed DNA polymerase n=1 Tax=Gorillibacterium sp. CAU 1737 TaxID=3140362 RepID=UPI00325FFB6B